VYGIQPNFKDGNRTIYGTVTFVSKDENSIYDLTEEQIKVIENYLNKNS